MRIIFLVITLVFSAGMHAYSQSLKVPGPVKTAFSKKFPNATDVKWGKENAHEYEAEFKQSGNTLSANFKENGSWVETESVLPDSEIPEAVKNSVLKKFPGATILLCEKTELPGNKVHYEVSFRVNQKKRSMELNANGTPVRK